MQNEAPGAEPKASSQPTSRDPRGTRGTGHGANLRLRVEAHLRAGGGGQAFGRWSQLLPGGPWVECPGHGNCRSRRAYSTNIKMGVEKLKLC